MVMISLQIWFELTLANMYLHGFPEPNVVEYDALNLRR
ncbi:MAG: hypothetical protein CM15mP96_1210 [Gammaproteobacteria bacterium]|nr:MAG: hypothetical protein CM15mP96_1210 [Gammaproteobacteria bacterium]